MPVQNATGMAPGARQERKLPIAGKREFSGLARFVEASPAFFDVRLPCFRIDDSHGFQVTFRAYQMQGARMRDTPAQMEAGCARPLECHPGGHNYGFLLYDHLQRLQLF